MDGGHTLPSLKRHFSRALAAGGGKLHLAAHSHHLWPDATYDAQIEAWTDAAALWDTKWSRVMGTVLPESRAHIARHLNAPDAGAIALAPTALDFVRRIMSALPVTRPPRVLTTDGEFHSFARLAARLAEDGIISLETVPVEPLGTFQSRFQSRAASGAHDFVFFSQVFFNSGFAVPDMDAIVAAIPRTETLVAIDGYHGLLARPTDISGIAHRAFYLGGGYKYVMAGEGACYCVCPPGYAPRPRDTGWFAGFGALNTARPGEVPYAEDGTRLMGATLDPTPFYRLNAAMRFLADAGIDAAAIHARARANHARLIPALDAASLPGLAATDLIVPADNPHRGNFLAYRSDHAPEQHARLMQAGIVTDLRGDVLRLGFGLYHDPDDTPEIAARITAALR